MKKKVFVEGMKCENCAKHVKEALSSIKGVISAEINLADKYAVIETISGVSDEAINIAVNNGKYKVTGIEIM